MNAGELSEKHLPRRDRDDHDPVKLRAGTHRSTPTCSAVRTADVPSVIEKKV